MLYYCKKIAQFCSALIGASLKIDQCTVLHCTGWGEQGWCWQDGGRWTGSAMGGSSLGSTLTCPGLHRFVQLCILILCQDQSHRAVLVKSRIALHYFALHSVEVQFCFALLVCGKRACLWPLAWTLHWILPTIRVALSYLPLSQQLTLNTATQSWIATFCKIILHRNLGSTIQQKVSW